MQEISILEIRMDHDLVFLSMVAGEEEIALQLLENKYFDRTHLNRRENKDNSSQEKKRNSLLATACYYACPKVVKVLLEDEEFRKQVGIEVEILIRRLVAPFYEVETKKEQMARFCSEKPYTIEEVEFVKRIRNNL